MTRSDNSDAIAKQIDDQVREIVKKCYRETLDIVNNNKAAMDGLVEVLVEKETIDGDEFREILSNYCEIPDKKNVENIVI